MHIPSLESRLAEWCLQHPVAQRLSFRTVNVLQAIERQDADIDEADARRLLQAALAAVITAEVLAGREVQS